MKLQQEEGTQIVEDVRKELDQIFRNFSKIRDKQERYQMRGNSFIM
jgi:hypothetical protein